jgi:hypothetical protein
MLTRICRYLKNWFVVKTYLGNIAVSEGKIYCNGSEIEMQEGQRFALVRTHYVYGAYSYGDEIEDYEFEGAVWIMDVPADVLDVAVRMTEWEAANGGVDSQAMSPYQSESFGGYSYAKGLNSKGKVGSSVFDNAEFAAVLSPFKKI